jgi:DNA damage-inducible protein 1
MVNLMFIIEGDDRMVNMTANDTDSIINLRDRVAQEFRVESNSVMFALDSREIGLDGTVQSSGIVDNSIIVVKRKARVTLDSLPPNMTPDQWIQITSQHPELIRQLSLVNPDMADVLETRDVSKLRLYMMQQHLKTFNRTHKEEQEMRAIEADPDNEENQRKIEQAIRLQNIETQRELAYEHMPEAFLQVCMLYVPLSINGHEIAAFVDSGAQSTIMSYELAERCSLTHLIDSRYAGEARGVGTGKILGRIHMAQMKFGNSFYPFSITILERSDVGFLFGLDMQKRHRCCIDLSQNVLRMETVNGIEVVPFLNEADIDTRRRKQGEKSDDEEIQKVDATDTNTGNSSSNSNTSNTSNAVPMETSSSSSETGVDRQTIIENLMALGGFSSQQAAAALHQANGDAELAATILFAMNS